MVCGKPLFPGTKVEDELYLIFKTLGTPTEDTFPGVTTNQDYIALNLPKFTVNTDNLSLLVPRLDLDGVELLSLFLKYNPKLRISAKDSIMHKFFVSFPPAVFKLDNSNINKTSFKTSFS